MANKTKLTLKGLYNNKMIYGKVVTLIQDNESYDTIIRYLQTKGYELSKSSISNLKSKITESYKTGVPIEELLDKRKKSNVTKLKTVTGFVDKDIDKNNVSDIIPNDGVSKRPKLNVKNEFFSSEQVIDSIIDKGVRTLNATDYVDTGTLMKAIDLKSKYFIKDSKGLSIDALQQYQVIQNAKLSALQQIVMEYIPEDKRDEAFSKMSEAEQEILDNVEMQEDGKDLLKALKKAGLDLS